MADSLRKAFLALATGGIALVGTARADEATAIIGATLATYEPGHHQLLARLAA
jgi:hypothetical protein